ncbi:MAG: mechanosensitive ion channel [Planctomycetota bacterium]
MPHLRALLLSLCWLLPSFATAQSTTPATQDAETTVEALQQRLDAVKADATLSDEARTTLVETLTRALDSARAAKALEKKAQDLDAAVKSAPERLAKRQGELAELEKQAVGPPRQGMTLAELEQGFAAAQQKQNEAQQAVADFDKEKARRAEQRQRLPDQISGLQKQLDAMPAQAPQPPPELDARLANARRLAYLTERHRLDNELAALQAELRMLDAEVELQRADGDHAARRATTTRKDADAWLAALQPVREQEAARAAAAAKQAAERAALQSPELAPMANENAKLAGIVAELATSLSNAQQDQTQRSQDQSNLERQFTEIDERVKVGANERIGQLLRRWRVQLAKESRRHQQITQNRRERIIDAQLKLIEYEERRSRLAADPSGWMQDQLKVPLESLAQPVQEAAEKLRKAREDSLEKLTASYRELVKTQSAIEKIEQQLTRDFATYRDYVTERVLGIRSAPPLWRIDAQGWHDFGTALASFADAGAWQGSLLDVVDHLLDELWPLLLLLVGLAALGARRFLGNRLTLHGEQAARGTNTSYLPTALAAIDTALLVLPLPAMIALVGWRVGVGAPSELQKAIATGLVEGALGLGIVLLLRVLVRPKGLAESHFRWQSTTISHLRKAGRLLLVIVVPFSFLLGALDVADDSGGYGTLATMLLVTQLVLLLIVAHRLLHPTTGFIGGRFKPIPGVVYRFRRLWHLLALGVLLTLVVMAMLGYQYTAQQLTGRLHRSTAILLAGVLVHAMILRSLLLARRRLSMQRTQARLQGDDASEHPAADLDPQSLTEQTQTLLRGAVVIACAVAVFQTWFDVLPALGLLDQVRWNIGTVEAPEELSLADLALGAFVLFSSVVAARNLPGLLELLVLRRMAMPAGERQAITTLARYAILIVGTVWAFSSIGVGWSKVQWLVAAMSVGLGFGLQEIFANFVSGLILLFERPVRVGDLVTVGETTGRVGRIQIRATTIVDWNNKELIVPNREFVTSHFVNWTLGNSSVRWIIPVGVAYGSDTALALQLLEKVSHASPHVLKDPEPRAYFLRFGDSTLDLELRVYIDIDVVPWHWISELHQAIDKAFREANVEIAFPQRDVHLKLPRSLEQALAERAAERGR